MGYIRGDDRGQLELMPMSLDDVVAADNAVRVIDAFVAGLDLMQLGFHHAQPAATGRPPYDPADLLKLYLYGYFNRVRSSRGLERESGRNLELMWLLNRLVPDFKTIADFRRDNTQALVGVCASFVAFCREQHLIAGEQVAIDGSKFAAVNSRDRLLTPQSVARKLERTERRIAQYLASLDEADRAEAGHSALAPEAVRSALDKLKARAEELRQAQASLAESGENQRALTDSDSRLMRKPDGGYTVGYNAQLAVDDQHKLIATVGVSQNANDQNELRSMGEAAKAAVQTQQLSVLVDGGYSNGEQAQRLSEQGVTVSAPNPDRKNHRHKLIPKSEFRYEPNTDSYRCPAGQSLSLERSDRSGRRIYSTTACGACAMKRQCTRATQRHIVRHPYQGALDAMHERVAKHPELMRLRAAIVEHPIAGLKRLTDGGRFLLKGIKKVKAELALAATAYNLRRVINILGAPMVLQALLAS